MLHLSSIASEFDVRPKNKPKMSLIHLLVFAFAWIYSLLSRDKSFFERYVTTIDNTMYVPVARLADFQSLNWSTEATYRHEYAHLLQSRQEKWYRLKYIFSSKYRLLYELEAYCHEIAHSAGYAVKQADLDVVQRVKIQMSYGSIYRFSFPFKLRLVADQQLRWNAGVDRLVNDCVRLCREDFNVKYLRDYGRLHSAQFKQIERHIQIMLDHI